jgi:tRNA threonylcarbamoyladenosine biosynthesis protein TsaB
MHTILAIDTSSELASVALSHEDRLFSQESSGVQTHSQTVLPMVQAVLAQARIALGDCAAIAFGAGPGSFTGVRTACGVAQGLAFGAGLPLIPVVSLQAMAEACRAVCGATDVLVLLDARMEEVYWAQYRYDNGCNEWLPASPPALSGAAQVQPIGAPVACGNGLAAYAAAFDAIALADRRPDIVPHAREIARLAQAGWRAGMAVEAHEAQPLYLRNKVALTTAEREAEREARVAG